MSRWDMRNVRQILKRETSAEAFCFTGDMAKRDAEGYYYITGRKNGFEDVWKARQYGRDRKQLLRGRYEGVELACTGEDDRMRIYMEGMDPASCEGGSGVPDREKQDFTWEVSGFFPSTRHRKLSPEKRSTKNWRNCHGIS